MTTGRRAPQRTQPPAQARTPQRVTRQPSLSAPRRVAGRGLAGLLLLAVLTGPPTVLLALVGNPRHVPSGLRSGDALTRPLDDATLLWLLGLVVWLMWLHLLGCLLTEAVQQTRGSSLRMPLSGLLFGANTLLASHLVAMLLLTSQPGQSSGLTAFTGAPVAATAAVTASVTAPAGLSPPLTPAVPPAGVTPAVLESPVGTATDSGGNASVGVECRVLPPDGRHHDTLWDIAERHLGDGLRWREIFALNDGRVMPDGHRLTHASRIRPGWILRLPADAKVLDVDRITPAPHHPSVAAAPPAPVHPRGNQYNGLNEPPAPHPGAEDTMDRDTPAPPPAQPQPRHDPAASSLSSPARPARPTPAHEHTSADQVWRQAEAGVGLGTLSVAALGLLTALTRRRKVAARRRPLGVRAARPAPELLAAETRLRQQARAADIAATVRLALLIAAPQMPTSRVKAVWEHPDGGIELVLTEHHSGSIPTPFTTTPRGWLLPRDGQRYLFAFRDGGLRRQDRDARLEQELQPAADPFPLLLPVGEHHGSACLVNLELFGLISVLSAKPDDVGVRELLAGWVPTLAGAPWAELVHLAIPPDWGPLAVGQPHVRTADPNANGTSSLPRPIPPHDRESLTDYASLEAARRAGAGTADVDGADVTLGFALSEVPDWLLAAALDPLDPNIVVLHEPHPDAHTWTLTGDGLLMIPGICDSLTPVRLDPAQHELMLRLLEYAQDPPQAAPDDPHRMGLDTACPPLTPEQLAMRRPSPPVIDLNHLDSTHTDTPAEAGADPRLDTTHDGADHSTVGDSDDEPVGEVTASVGDVAAGVPSEDAPWETRQPAPSARQAHEAARDTSPPAPRLSPVEVGVLGPIEVHGELDAQPRQQALEMLVYLSLHRQPITLEAMSEAIWPDRGYHDRTVQNRIGDLRRYLGDNHLIKVSGRWRLTDLVTSDWQRFKTLAGGNPEQQLRALALVRGIPLAPTKRDWMYLDGTFAEIEASIVDLALIVGQRAMKTGHYAAARDAAHAGLRGCPFDERLYRLGIESAAARNATAEIRQLTNQLRWVMDTEIEPDDTIQPATNDLLQRLRDDQDRERHRQRRQG